VSSGAVVSGLLLARNRARTDAPYIVTEAHTGVGDGRLYRLRQSTRRQVRVSIDSADEQKAPASCLDACRNPPIPTDSDAV
jgi:hypothetical protein